MARAAVKANSRRKQQERSAAAEAPRASRGRRRKHAGGGNPNQQLFFCGCAAGRSRLRHPRRALRRHVRLPRRRLRHEQRPRPALQRHQHLRRRRHVGLEGAEGDQEAPERPEGLPRPRDRLRGEGRHRRTRSARSSSTRRSSRRTRRRWTELGGLQLDAGAGLLARSTRAPTRPAARRAEPPFRPTGKLGTAIGHDPIEQAASQHARTRRQRPPAAGAARLQRRRRPRTTAAKLQPKNSNAWFQLAQAAQTAGDTNDGDQGATSDVPEAQPGARRARRQIKQLIKQLAASPGLVRLRRDTEPGENA